MSQTPTMMPMSMSASPSFNPCKEHPASEGAHKKSGLGGFSIFGIVVGVIATAVVVAVVSYQAGKWSRRRNDPGIDTSI